MSAEEMLGDVVDDNCYFADPASRMRAAEQARSSVKRRSDYDEYDRADRAFDRSSRDSETDHDKYLDYYNH